jgi:hypothetical protein
MEYKHLPLTCHCGEIPFHIEEVGFTEDHQLVVHWWCTKCQRVVYVSKPLTDCWRECPAPSAHLKVAAPPFAAKPAYGAEDIQFLGAMGIRLT